MTVAHKMPEQVEFGDFQTPKSLAERVVQVIQRKGKRYQTVIEPTCGVGNILYAAADHLQGLETAVGIEVNPAYVAQAKARQSSMVVRVELANFFDLDLSAVTAALPWPYIFLGNPPWVTSAAVGQLEGSNLPKKENFAGLGGFEALTGKSNFDVSEWILLRLLENVAATENACAMLVKTSVARKIVAHAARQKLAVRACELYSIDAKKEFDVSVSACLFYFEGCKVNEAEYSYTAFSNLDGNGATHFTYVNGQFVEDQAAFERTQQYARTGKGNWRSGIKHDASKVMELRKLGGQLLTSTGEPLDIEPDLVYPLLKSSDIAKGNTTPRLYTIVTQQTIGESTEGIRTGQPKTWAYLEQNRAAFDGRKSSIYRGKPPFSIFGVGDYSFAPYKIAISGLYKTLKFTLLEPLDGKPVMVDDTCYFLGFDDRKTALISLAALEHPASTEFFMARIQWDEKRPVKKDVLDSLNLEHIIQRNLKEVQVSSEKLGVTLDEFHQRTPTPTSLLFQ